MTQTDYRIQRLEEEKNNRTSEIQKQLETVLSESYDRALVRMNRVVPIMIRYPGQLMTIDEVKNNIKSLLVPTLLTLCTGDIKSIDLSVDIKTEYYDTLIASQINSITYSILCITSDYVLGMLLYYIQKEFVFNFILNDIVRPNISEAIEQCRNILTKKDILDEELRKTEEFSTLLQELIDSLMISMNIDMFQSKLMSVINFKIKDKQSLIKTIFDSSKIFVPDVLYTIVTNSSATDVDIERASKFIERYSVLHSEKAITELFQHYSNAPIDKNVVINTIRERNDYHNVNNLQVIDGLNFTEVKIVNRIISFTTAEEDKEFIETSELLKNIKMVVDKFHTYKSTIKLEENDVVITDENGESKRYNVRKEGLSKIISDPFSIFVRSDFVRHLFFNNKTRSALYQTGITKAQDNDLLASFDTRAKLNSKTPEERVQHRNLQIQRLKAELERDTETMKEYERLISGKIETIKYMNPTQSKTYVIEDKAKLLLTLTETECLYKQLLNETAANAASNIYKGGR